MDGVQINPTMEVSIVTDPRTIRALLDVLQRIPMTALESVAIEQTFERWFAQVREQAMQAAAMSKLEGFAAMQDLTAAGAAGDVPSGPPAEPAERVGDDIDPLAGTPAAMNDAPAGEEMPEHTPDASSAAPAYDGTQSIVN